MTVFRTLQRVSALLLAIAFASGCATPTAEVVRPAPGTLYPTRPPAKESPRGDAFSQCGGEPTGGVLIEDYTLTDDTFSVTWWVSETDGFVWSRGFTSVIMEGCNPKVDIASAAERQALIAYWRDLGYAARVTGADGRATEVTNVFVCQSPPSGYYWQYGGQVREQFIRMPPGEMGYRYVYFGDLERVDRKGAEFLLTYRDGATEIGAPEPYVYTVEFVASLCGIQPLPDEGLTGWELPLEQVISIEFLSAPKITAAQAP